MLSSIISILIMTIILTVLNVLWYSKFLFKNALNNLTQNNWTPTTNRNYIIMGIVCLVQSILIYYLTYNIFFILPQTFFVIVLLIALLIIVNIWGESILRKENLKLTLIRSGLNLSSSLLAFLVALLLIN
ncbi:hypothetical protein ABSA28_00471 [Candidatus Hepatincolaceae symbiont of Richtersius coronifer]